VDAQRTLTLVVAVAMATLSLAPAAVAERSQTEPYATGADVVLSCEEERVGSLLGGNYGSVCFDVQDGESFVGVEIDDIYVDGVGGVLEFKDADGGAVGDQTPFCGSVENVGVPSEAASLEVFTNGPGTQLVDCGSVGTSTFGDVTATFS
jgi:hypothetical protein